MAGILFIISAPSGSGKSTLVSELRKQVKDVDFSISWTTRPPRGSEENGREYYFTTRDEFERMISEGKFLEHAEVFGNYYGTARHSLEDARKEGHDLLLDIDVQGAAQVRSTMPEAVSIFVLPPTPKVLRTRLRNRSRAEGVVNEAEVYRRLSEAAKEIENYRNYSYILINDILDRAVAQLEAIVLAERYYRNAEPIAYRSSRVLEVAAGCRLSNSRDRLKPVLEAFGIEGGNGQQQLPFGDDNDDD
ncbi:guanylate kinase [Occallatibacter savannae]|uniref:guanylate kinase n=1 Tax=Occallatibacter savannae TaxID=1002691 RepID=UPI000D686EA7|nr:guanylate kinase [Occallatibacter savannae]